MSRIKQAFISTALNSYRERFLTKYGFEEYGHKTMPAVFFGCYANGRPDLDKIINHQNTAVLVWGGSDAMGIRHGRYHRVLMAPHIRHIAISKWISQDLMKCGVSHWYIPITPATFDSFKPVPLGDKVYVYTSHNSPHVYGQSIVDKVKKKCPGVEFMIRYANPPGHTPQEQIADDYAQCFTALRLTRHDGLSNTVVEMGLMGRRVIWNGWLSNSVPWTDANDIARFVNREKNRAGNMQQDVADAVLHDLQLPDWTDTRFYL